MKQRSFCAGCPDYSIERLEVANMTFDELLKSHKHHSKTIIEYGQKLAKGPFGNDPYYEFLPLWLRTHAAYLKHIQDELQVRAESEFSPYLGKVLEEVLA
ncbi:hypothetical protein KZP23_07495 [Echinicola marina]|uniref:hypothetical protein n=1 Tax=Echinicola marina TaxID=2859768 RepID=UPI001CF6BE89|nr:hypothetical protein [Echinicola marina]UCS94844.1 hypothetical protein KZP23_07495 [Echinicola marina]